MLLCVFVLARLYVFSVFCVYFLLVVMSLVAITLQSIA